MAEELKERKAFEAHMRVGGYSNPDKHPDGSYVSSAMELWWQGWKARALLPSQGGEAVALTVWCGPMPESNGKSNFTAILMRKGADMFDGIAGGITIARSEYPDRVRYEADRMRYLIGELDAEPDILAYDPDKHSGYTHPADQVAEGVRGLLERALPYLNNTPDLVQFGAEELAGEIRALLAKSEGVKS